MTETTTETHYTVRQLANGQWGVFARAGDGWKAVPGAVWRLSDDAGMAAAAMEAARRRRDEKEAAHGK